MSEELQQVEAATSMSAGFNKVRGIEETPPTETPAQEPKHEPVATPEPTPEPVIEDEEMFPGMTKSQVKDILSRVPDLEKQNRRLNGKIGELVGIIKQTQPAAVQPGSDGAPARKLQADALKRLHAEYPDLADALSEDLGALMPNDPKQVEDMVSTRLQAALEERDQKQAVKDLKREHKDWETVVVSPDFKLWKNGLSEAQQEEFDSTWDADVVAGYITQFKTHRESLARQGQRKTARLEGAVVPKGDGGAATSKLPDSAGLRAGFLKVRRLSP